MSALTARRTMAFAALLAIAAMLSPAAGGWPHWRIACAVLLCLVAGWIAAVDMSRLIIPDTGVLTIGALGLVLGWMDGLDAVAVLGSVVLAAALGVALWAATELYGRLRGMDVLGFGDIKLLVASSLLVGPWGVGAQVAIASIAAIIFAMIRSWRKGRPLRSAMRLPFGTFLAPALVLVWAWTLGGAA